MSSGDVGNGIAASSGSCEPGIAPVIQKRVFKIIVVGDSCVGKTCLTYRFCEGRFPRKTEATIGVDFREKSVNVDGEIIKVGKLPCNDSPSVYHPFQPHSFSFGIQLVRKDSVDLWSTTTTGMCTLSSLCTMSHKSRHLR